MAGDWLKFEKSTPDKPEVFAIASALKLDPDAVVGKLIRVWSWFDTHTTDGNGRGVTSTLLDRISGVTGFVAAMESVGWVEITSDGVRLPNFDRHTGETAKGRALTAKRVANYKRRANAKSNDDTVTSALPREEKRREEEQKQEQKHVQRAAARFAEFWSAYPVKKGKAAAEKAWRSKRCDPIADQIIAHVQLMTALDDDWRRGFVPHGSTYVNGERWNDEPKGAAPPRAGPQQKPMGKTAQALIALEELSNGGLDSAGSFGGVQAADVLEPGEDAGSGGYPTDRRRLAGGFG